MNTTGKKLEALIKLAAEEQGVDYTRLNDAGHNLSTHGGADHQRFTPKNICDCIMFYDGAILFAEVKHRHGALRFDEIKQMDRLGKKWKPEIGVYSGVICQLKGDIYFVSYEELEKMEMQLDKKSFNASDAGNYGIELEMISVPRKRNKRPDILCIYELFQN